ncbi:MAG: peptidylprolyl isomerase [Anaerolineales bacterium]
MPEPLKVDDDLVVSLDYVLRVDDQEMDSSSEEDGGPVEFIQGAGEIISGLEEALYGLRIGEGKTIQIEPEAAYGHVDPEAVKTIKKEEFPEGIPLEPGVMIELTDDEGDVELARIESVKADKVVLDFNHPLAGKTLEFEIMVRSLRPATESELQHGHVHGPDTHDE